LEQLRLLAQRSRFSHALRECHDARDAPTLRASLRAASCPKPGLPRSLRLGVRLALGSLCMASLAGCLQSCPSFRAARDEVRARVHALPGLGEALASALELRWASASTQAADAVVLALERFALARGLLASLAAHGVQPPAWLAGDAAAETVLAHAAGVLGLDAALQVVGAAHGLLTPADASCAPASMPVFAANGLRIDTARPRLRDWLPCAAGSAQEQRASANDDCWAQALSLGIDLDFGRSAEPSGGATGPAWAATVLSALGAGQGEAHLTAWLGQLFLHGVLPRWLGERRAPPLRSTPPSYPLEKLRLRDRHGASGALSPAPSTGVEQSELLWSQERLADWLAGCAAARPVARLAKLGEAMLGELLQQDAGPLRPQQFDLEPDLGMALGLRLRYAKPEAASAPVAFIEARFGAVPQWRSLLRAATSKPIPRVRTAGTPLLARSACGSLE
jgi:hypothetical protein